MMFRVELRDLEISRVVKKVCWGRITQIISFQILFVVPVVLVVANSGVGKGASHIGGGRATIERLGRTPATLSSDPQRHILWLRLEGTYLGAQTNTPRLPLSPAASLDLMVVDATRQKTPKTCLIPHELQPNTTKTRSKEIYTTFDNIYIKRIKSLDKKESLPIPNSIGLQLASRISKMPRPAS